MPDLSLDTTTSLQAIKDRVAQTRNVGEYPEMATENGAKTALALIDTSLEKEPNDALSIARHAILALLERALDQERALTDALRACSYSNDVAGAAIADVQALQEQRGLLQHSATALLPYLQWQTGADSPGYHPTLPSAIDRLKNALALQKQF